MRLAIFSRRDSPIAARIATVAAERGIGVVRVDLGAIGHRKTPFVFEGQRWYCDGHDLNEVDAYALVSYPSAAGRVDSDPQRVLTAEACWEANLKRWELADLTQSLLFDIEGTGKPIVNPPMASAPFNYKPLQLATLERHGVALPPTVVTNVAAVLRAFCDTVGEVIHKPVVGFCSTQVLDPASLPEGEGASVPLRIYQQRIRGKDIRVTLVDGEPVSVVEIPTSSVDYRDTPGYADGRQQYLPHVLPEATLEQCRTTARACHHILAGIDLKLTPSGEYVLLESNSAPVYLDIERKTGAPITAAIVSYLCKRAAGA